MVSLKEPIDDPLGGRLGPRREIVGDRQTSGRVGDLPARTRGALWLEEREELSVPLGALEGWRRREHEEMVELGADARDPVLEVGVQLVQLIDDQDLKSSRLDVRERQLGCSARVLLVKLLLPSEPDVLPLARDVRVVRRGVRAGHQLVAPLRYQPVRDDDQRAQVWALAAQRVQDHQRLDRLAQPDLVGE
ncbi:MAG: hypothetical protein ABIQ65_02935 [Thermoanaerobaculia bacterium]